MLKIRFSIILIIFMFVSITPASAYQQGEIQNSFTNTMQEIKDIGDPTELGMFEQIKLLYTAPKLIYQISSTYNEVNEIQKQTSVELEEPDSTSIPYTLQPGMSVGERKQILQKNLGETLTYLNSQGNKFNSASKKMPEKGDLVQLVVKDPNYHNNVSYIRYMVYEGFNNGYHKFSARSWEKTDAKQGTVLIDPEDLNKAYTGYVISKPAQNFSDKVLNALAKYQALQYRDALGKCDAQVQAYKDYYWFTIWFNEEMYAWVAWIIGLIMGATLDELISAIKAIMNPANGDGVSFLTAVKTVLGSIATWICAHPIIFGIIVAIIVAIIIFMVVMQYKYKNYQHYVGLWEKHKNSVADAGYNFLSYGKGTHIAELGPDQIVE